MGMLKLQIASCSRLRNVVRILAIFPPRIFSGLFLFCFTAFSIILTILRYGTILDANHLSLPFSINRENVHLQSSYQYVSSRLYLPTLSKSFRPH
jgi:hypothetical protein